MKVIVVPCLQDNYAYLVICERTGKAAVVDIAPERPLPRPVTLAEIKASKAFASFALTRLPRLSVMPVSDAEWKEIERLAKVKS